MWTLNEYEDAVWIYRDHVPIQKLDPESDSRIIRPARAMTPAARSAYLQGILDGMAKTARDQMPEPDATGQGVMFR